MDNKKYTLKPIDVYIKEVYELAEKIKIEPINWEEIFKIEK